MGGIAAMTIAGIAATLGGGGLPLASAEGSSALLATMNLWYALPLIVTVSLVCAATRHELIRPILEHAVRFAVWVLLFMGLFMVLLGVMQRMA